MLINRDKRENIMIIDLKNYTIEMRQFKITIAEIFNFAHNFWVRRDPEGRIISELHGLATDRKYGTPKPVGWFVDRIQPWLFPIKPHDPIEPNNSGFSGLFRLDQHSRVYFSGSKEEAEEIWSKAKKIIPEITKLDINYWAILVDCKGGNSNSVARTFADTMGFSYSRITYPDPGSEKNLLTGHCDRNKEIDTLLNQFKIPVRSINSVDQTDVTHKEPESSEQESIHFNSTEEYAKQNTTVDTYPFWQTTQSPSLSSDHALENFSDAQNDTLLNQSQTDIINNPANLKSMLLILSSFFGKGRSFINRMDQTEQILNGKNITHSTESNFALKHLESGINKYGNDTEKDTFAENKHYSVNRV